MKKFTLTLTAIFTLFISACDIDFSVLTEAENNLEYQLAVSRVVCNSVNMTDLPIDTMYVGVGYQCAAFNPDGAEIRWGGQTFAFGGWYVMPDSAAIITIQGLVTPKYANSLFNVHARGTLDSDAAKTIWSITP